MDVVLGRKKANGRTPDLLRVRDRNSPIRPAMSRCRYHAKTCKRTQAPGQLALLSGIVGSEQWAAAFIKKKTG